MLTRATNRAVSPVIGVVLMVAITVLLAAVVGVFTLGNTTTQPAPQAQLTVDEQPGSNNITVVHDGGDAVDTDQLTPVGSDIIIVNKNTGKDNRLQAGESLVISNASSSTLKQGDVIRIRWDAPDSSRSTTFLKYKLSDRGWN